MLDQGEDLAGSGPMNDKSVLAIFAHPDDETFRAGGTLALQAAHGFRVHIFSATRGDAGSCGSPPLCTPDELPFLRQQELRCACQVLGLESPTILTYPDGQLPSIDPKEIISDILGVIDRIQPQSMVSFGEDGLSGHPDHIAIGQYALRAFHEREGIRSYYTLAVPQSIADKLEMTQIRALPDESVTHTIDVSEVWEAKLKAIHCHQTQIQESPILNADQDKKRLFLGKEHFRLVENRNNANSEESSDHDILQGLVD